MISRKMIQLSILSFLLIGFIFTSSSALAYWQEVTVTRDVEIVTVGEPVRLLVTDINDGNSNLQLVPNGYVVAVGDVEEVVLQYEVEVSRELLNTVDLHIAVTDILINDSDQYSHLVEIDILGFGDEATVDLFNDTLTVTVTVRITEPIDAEEALEKGLNESRVNVEDSVLAYETINGQAITFSLEFIAQPKEETGNNN